MAIKFKNINIENKDLLEKALKLPLCDDSDFEDNNEEDLKEWVNNMERRIDIDLKTLMEMNNMNK